MPKSWIHPQYTDAVEVTCVCGASYKLSGAVTKPIKVETCPQCHPVYTGKKETRVIKWRMEKFLEKQKKIDQMKAA
jgi:large subunit ribosomal protein L31